MLFQRYLLIPLFLVATIFSSLNAQEKSASHVYVKHIVFSGLKKTKELVAKRELTFKEGDALPIESLLITLEENTQRLLNMNLFTSVEFKIADWNFENGLEVEFLVKERFYLSGYFIFDLADRNFNVWWTEQNRRLDRLNYGFRIKHENITGAADQLSFGLTLGFTRKIDLEYDTPSINKKRTLGLRTKIFYAQNRETNYTTSENRFQFYRDDAFQLQRFKIETRWTYRPKLDIYHLVDIGYFHNSVSDKIGKELNVDYFLDGRTQQRYIEIGYNLVFDKRREKPYTLKGWYTRINLIQSGLSIFDERNVTTLRTTLAKYFMLSEKVSFEMFNRTQVFLSKEKQAYFNNRALGDRKDYLSGYELYAIDGTDFSYLKTSFKYRLTSRNLDFPNWKLLQRTKLFPVPFQVYAIVYGDVGYVNEAHYNETNDLTNQMLWGCGIGLDFIVMMDKIFQVQYSMNHLLENGLFLHYKHKF